MAGLLLLSLNSHSHKKMFVTVTSSTVRPMAFSTKTNEILIHFQRVPCVRADLVYLHSARMRDDTCAGLAIYTTAVVGSQTIPTIYLVIVFQSLSKLHI